MKTLYTNIKLSVLALFILSGLGMLRNCGKIARAGKAIDTGTDVYKTTRSAKAIRVTKVGKVLSATARHNNDVLNLIQLNRLKDIKPVSIKAFEVFDNSVKTYGMYSTFKQYFDSLSTENKQFKLTDLRTQPLLDSVVFTASNSFQKIDSLSNNHQTIFYSKLKNLMFSFQKANTKTEGLKEWLLSLQGNPHLVQYMENRYVDMFTSKTSGYIYFYNLNNNFYILDIAPKNQMELSELDFIKTFQEEANLIQSSIIKVDN